MQKDDQLNQEDPLNKNQEDNNNGQDPKKKRKKRKKHKHKKKEDEEKEKAETKKEAKKPVFSNEQFIINGNYNLIKMLGFGAFGEIHLAYDTNSKQLRAIKFEIAAHKNPQLKHEHTILDQLNKGDNNTPAPPEGIVGIPRVYGFDRMENKYNYMIMDFLGPSLSDLFQFKEKQFTYETIWMIAIQMMSRAEYIHEKGFIHRDIKPENFVIGINDRTNIVHIIDFGLSKRYKDKTSGQHIPYRENRHLVGTVRYASINAHLGIDQSRRDDIESIGYVLLYFCLARLPWQSNQEKGKPPANKIMEKKLITPPEILCKKLPGSFASQFAYYFHYCKNLKFEDRPDYSALKRVFAEMLFSLVKIDNKFTFDWFDDGKNKRPLISINSINNNDDDNDENKNKNEETPGMSLNMRKEMNKNPIEEFNPNIFIEKYKSPRKNELGIENRLKDSNDDKKQGVNNPLGIIKHIKDSKSYSESDDSDDSEQKSSEDKEKNSSESNYGVIKDDNDVKLKVKMGKDSDDDEDEDNNDNEDDDIKLHVKK